MVVTGVVHGTSFLLTYYASLLSKEGQGLGELLNEIKVPRFFYIPKLLLLRLACCQVFREKWVAAATDCCYCIVVVVAKVQLPTDILTSLSELWLIESKCWMWCQVATQVSLA